MQDSRTIVSDIRRVYPNNLGESVLTSVSELGFKCRVVTKSHPLTVCSGHEWRRKLFPTLRTSRVWSRALGDKPKALSFLKKKGCLLFSADLSRATDGISHHTAGIMCSYAQINPDLVFRNMTIDGQPLKRGIFMGLPMSWIFLSYIHRAVCRAVDPSENYYLKGDDLLAFWTRGQISLYRELVATVGMPLNEKKTFSGKRLGTFCEGFYKLSPPYLNRSGITKVWAVRQPTFSLRRFFPSSEDSAFSLSESIKDIDLDLRLQYNRCVYTAYPGYVRISRKLKLNPFLPPSLGGSGLLVPSPNQELHSSYDRMRVNAIFGGVPMFHHGPISLNVNSTTKQLNQLLNRVRFVPEGSGPVCDHFDEWFSFAAAAAAIRDAKIGIFPKSGTDHDFFNSCKRIARDRRKGIDFRITYGELRAVCARLKPLASSVPFKHVCG